MADVVRYHYKVNMMDVVLYHYIVWEFAGCTVRHFPLAQTTETLFPDGAKVVAAPMDTDAYRQTAEELGYGEDTARMCVEHEFLHTLLSVLAGDPHSPVLWDVAHGRRGNAMLHVLEEQRVLDFQMLLNDVPTLLRPGWNEWRDIARTYLKIF